MDNLNNSLSDIDEFVSKEIDKISSIINNNKTANSKFEKYLSILKEYQKRKIDL